MNTFRIRSSISVHAVANFTQALKLSKLAAIVV
ncbi:Uncharacterised protein [Vibrio cholerae]|nr:Uncharacterised protein [Vibrio cholerae]